MECHYCQKALTETTRTRDHVVARALGGLDIRWNIVWACKKCNGEKANKYSTCACAFCKRTRRRHWERLGIRDPHGAPRGRVRARARKVS